MRSLRIFYAAHPSPNALAFPESRIWHWNLYAPLVDLGHDVVEFDFDLTPHFQHLEDEAFIAAHRPELERALLHQIEEAHRERPIDLFFSYFYSACITPSTLAAIRAMGIITVNWFCNASYQFHLVAEIAPAYDYCLVPEQFRLDDYRRVGANPIYCQEAANPNIYRPRPVPRDLDVVFVGQRYGDRPALIRALIEAGIDTRVWGAGWLPGTSGPGRPGARWRRRLELVASPAGWRRIPGILKNKVAPPTTVADGIPRAACGSLLADEEIVTMYSRAKISLGFSSVGETHRGQRIVQVRLRDFEAPMSGAFYLLEYFPEIDQFFDVGREIVCYRDAADLVDKARYYLAHDDERERIREAGRARALRDHTWHKRFESAFQAMGLG